MDSLASSMALEDSPVAPQSSQDEGASILHKKTLELGEAPTDSETEEPKESKVLQKQMTLDYTDLHKKVE